MFRFSALNWVWIFLYAVGIVIINYWSKQDFFASTALIYAVLFSIYIYFVRIRADFSEKSIDFLALFFHLIPLFSIPSLSPDVYRFIWDGEILTQGIHPYAYTPQELINQSFLDYNSYLASIYPEITELSQRNYSLYPTVNQIYFLVPALITESVWAAVILMKILVLGTCILGYVYLKKILRYFKLSTKIAFIIAANPFIIIEMTGNLHFEGVMLSWLFVAFYFVLTKKWIMACIFWAIAINVKLTPILLLPFLLRFVGWKIALKFYVLTSVLALGILSLYLWPSVFDHFMSSLGLYFNNFQFNSSIFAISEFLLYPVFDYETILVVGPLLSKISFVIICFIAIFKPINSGKIWLQRMLMGYVIYLLFATTVHPWYIALPFGLSLFYKNTFMIGWTLLIMLSYGFYAVENHYLSVGLIVTEYIGLFALLIMDIFSKKEKHFFQRLLRL